MDLRFTSEKDLQCKHCGFVKPRLDLYCYFLWDDGNLLKAGNEHLVRGAELLLKLGNHAARVFVFESCHDVSSLP